METIITNKYNLKEEDMTEIVKRIKIFFINSKQEILLGYSHNDYQFPGGHVEENETFIQAINREIREETGMELKILTLKPFACAIGYYKDWPEEGKNRKIEIYYYEIITDEKPNLENTQYTESEKEGNFELRYIPLEKVEDELNKNALKYGDKKGITKEMLELLKIYKNYSKFQNNMVQILRIQLAMEDFLDNTGVDVKEVKDAFLELNNLRDKKDILDAIERIEMSEKVIDLFNKAFDVVGKDKFIFYEDGDINYIWDNSLVEGK